MNNKPAAIIAPMKHVAAEDTKKPSPAQNPKVEKQEKSITSPPPVVKSSEIKKPSQVKTEKVARKRITPPTPDKKPKDSNSSSSIEKSVKTEEEVKKARKRITAPEPDPSPIPTIITQEVCKFWPRCKRGSSCIYLHPKSPRPVPTSSSSTSISSSLPPTRDKFKWTSSSTKK